MELRRRIRWNEFKNQQIKYEIIIMKETTTKKLSFYILNVQYTF